MAKYKPGRYSECSSYNARQRRLARERGAFSHEGQPWTNEQNDLLLEGYLVHHWGVTSPDPARPSFQSELGRTEQGVFSQLWKLATNYPTTHTYEPVQRTDRTGRAFDERDVGIVMAACRPVGCKQEAHAAPRLAKLLGRTVAEVQAWLCELAADKACRKKSLLGRVDLTPEQREQQFPILVKQELQRLINRGRLGILPLNP